ncbi:hypothetical protein ONS95_001598 [Cadophora gregata]|uniref:uncharacterized protein n=1 Tax=Cadophora gregata TaxID=51156 RepID=UPI0026DCE294|nr:uncharacterized protein ONS95_001598 [Cadophora gregata]KAK0111223.1 hypothetical protein ONS95_001598 [Cadophora gregata]KAK0112306.1 hypothetical protein ONS96_001553 [Cadophora gregata f. sp. sojae]
MDPPVDEIKKWLKKSSNYVLLAEIGFEWVTLATPALERVQKQEMSLLLEYLQHYQESMKMDGIPQRAESRRTSFSFDIAARLCRACCMESSTTLMGMDGEMHFISAENITESLAIDLRPGMFLRP